MRPSTLFFASLLAGHTLAQVATVTDYVTVPSVAVPTTLTASERVKQVTDESSAQQTTTFATSTQYSSSAQTASTAASAPGAGSTGEAYNGGSAGSGTDINSDAGASGSGSSFSISKGGLIAIIVVVVVVAIFGVGSTILFVVAKRRQWNIRASIRRASRRITGRGAAPATPRTPGGRGNRQTTMNAGRLASPRVGGGQGGKDGVRVEMRDIERGARGDGLKTKGKAWQKLRGNDWK